MIRGGQEGYDRLLVLTRDTWPDTATLFGRAGLSPGMHCVDLGCGGGEITLEIARLVAPGGSVTGVDMDEVKLDLARQEAVRRGLDNVEFRVQNLNDWDEPGVYDAVNCRFVLQHLSRPIDLLRRMWAAVRPGGILTIEDADFDGWCCHPPNEGFDFFVRCYNQVLDRRGGDHASGRKLFESFLATGIPDPEVNLVQSVWIAGEAKTLAWSTLNTTAEAIVSAGVATAGEVEAALADLAEYTADPRTLLAGPRIFQLWSRR